ncbi:MAG: DivIVA domain-containing protein [Gemmatimonadota bacterium]|nr:DivIVA domain-containing protein [Gemmatimonadota bacterium]
MIDLTPLDVRKKRGDFKKMLRGYDPQEVDTFLELVAERLEALVKEGLALKERTDMLAEQVKIQEGREKAIQEALVTAQTLREDIAQQASREAESVRAQAKREAEMVTRQAEAEARQIRESARSEVANIRQQAVGDTELLRKKTEAELERLTHELEGLIEEKTGLIDELERKRTRFLRAFRSLLERELDAVAIEEGKVASEDAILELDLTGGQRRVQARMIETAALDMLQDEEPAEAESADPAPEVDQVERVGGGFALASEGDHTPDLGLSEKLEIIAERTEEAPNDPTHQIPDESALDEAVDAVLVEASAGPHESDAQPAETLFDLSVAAPALETEGQPAPVAEADPSPVDLLVDRAFAILDDDASRTEGPSAGDLADDSLSGGAEEPREAISIDTLAPQPENSLDDKARDAVNQLFDRDDVPVPQAEESSDEVEDAWTRVLRGEGVSGEEAGTEGKGSWSPNFPDKGRKSEGSGWSRSKDSSRWR